MDDQQQNQPKPLTNVERPVQQPESLKEEKQREVEKSDNPYPHTLRELER